jgi:hypothetical protein
MIWRDYGDSRTGPPRIVKLALRTDTDYFTFAKEGEPQRTAYAIVGTDYGFLHNTSGSIRLWKSYSGAYKKLRNYLENQ